MPTKITDRAKAIATLCADAYSADRYNNWALVAQLLIGRGYNDYQVIGILRSKWTRWAADASDAKYGTTPARAILNYLDDPRNRVTVEDVNKLVVL